MNNRTKTETTCEAGSGGMEETGTDSANKDQRSINEDKEDTDECEEENKPKRIKIQEEVEKKDKEG